MTGKLNPFQQSKLTYGFPFRETPSTYTTLDYLTGEGRLQLLLYFYITMGVRWLLIRWSGGGCALSIRLGVFSPLLGPALFRDMCCDILFILLYIHVT